MFGRKSTLLDPDIEAFHIQCWSWLLRNSGGMDAHLDTPLVLPTVDFYPATTLEGHERGKHIFDLTAQHAGMSDWPVELYQHEPEPEEMPMIGVVQNSGGAAGTYSNDGHGNIITYDPEQLDDPLALIATFAHELGHYLNGKFDEPPPGGAELMEPATDVTAAFLGFGVFGLCTSFRHNQWQDPELAGWSTSTLGYISESEWALNLAIFCGLRKMDIKSLKPFLKVYLFSELKKATKYLEKNGIVAEILEDGVGGTA